MSEEKKESVVPTPINGLVQILDYSTYLAYSEVNNISAQPQEKVDKTIIQTQFNLDSFCNGNMLKMWNDKYYEDPNNALQKQYLIFALVKAVDYYWKSAGQFLNMTSTIQTTLGQNTISPNTDGANIDTVRKDIANLLKLANCYVMVNTYTPNGLTPTVNEFDNSLYDLLLKLLVNDNKATSANLWSALKTKQTISSLILDSSATSNTQNTYSVAKINALNDNLQKQIDDFKNTDTAKYIWDPITNQYLVISEVSVIKNLVSDNTINKSNINNNTNNITTLTNNYNTLTSSVDTIRNDLGDLGNTVNDNTRAIDLINEKFPSYQKKLIAGNNITIDNATNTISAIGDGSGNDLLTQPNTWTQTQTFKSGAWLGNVVIENGSPKYIDPAMQIEYVNSLTIIGNNSVLGGTMIGIGMINNNSMVPYNIPNIMITSSTTSNHESWMKFAFNNIEPFNLASISTPTQPLEIANKQYVDDVIRDVPTSPNLLPLDNTWSGSQTLNNVLQMQTSEQNFTIASTQHLVSNFNLLKYWNGNYRNYLTFNFNYKNTQDNSVINAFSITSKPNFLSFMLENDSAYEFKNMNEVLQPINIGEPTADTHAATKNYVDTAIANVPKPTQYYPFNHYIALIGNDIYLGSAIATNTVIHFPISQLEYNPSSLYRNETTNSDATMGITENGMYRVSLNFYTNGTPLVPAYVIAKSMSGVNCSFVLSNKKQQGAGFSAISGIKNANWDIKVMNASESYPVLISIVLVKGACVIEGFLIKKIADLGTY